jgi:hypothetical protein
MMVSIGTPEATTSEHLTNAHIALLCDIGEEAVGKVTGDTKTQAEGAAEKTAGKVQNAIGGAKDAAREALKK